MRLRCWSNSSVNYVIIVATSTLSIGTVGAKVCTVYFCSNCTISCIVRCSLVSYRTICCTMVAICVKILGVLPLYLLGVLHLDFHQVS